MKYGLYFGIITIIIIIECGGHIEIFKHYGVCYIGCVCVVQDTIIQM